MFKPKLLTNQVIFALFLGMALILLPLFLPAAKAGEDRPPPPLSRPEATEGKSSDENSEDSDSGEPESPTLPVCSTWAASSYYFKFLKDFNT